MVYIQLTRQEVISPLKLHIIFSLPAAGGHELNKSLHPTRPLQEGQKLLALGHVSGHVGHPVSWSVLLVMQTLPTLHSLLLSLQ